MKNFDALKVTLLGLLLVGCISLSFGQSTVKGKITSEVGDPLIGASVIVKGTTVGTVTDFDGTFTLNSDEDYPITVVISYTGFQSAEVEVTSSDDIAVSLVEGITIGEEIVISASRRREKVIEAPASISVLTERKLQSVAASATPARAIINEPGVHMQQQGAGRVNIQLRGDGGIFGSATFPILDYRSLSGPGLGTFDVLNSPVNNLDLEKIEVVRGSGSALYGPGVTAGVIHFISKSPIDRPGTSIELMGGEQATYGITARHATKVSDKFGFKITGFYKRGDEFLPSFNVPIEADHLNGDVLPGSQNGIFLPGVKDDIVDATLPGTQLLTFADLDEDGDGNPLQDFWESWALTGALEFRPQDDFSITVAGGANFGNSLFYNSQGEGRTYSTESWAQVRLQKGGFFAQAFYLHNDGGTDENPTFLYQTGLDVGVNRRQLEAQLQYNFDAPNFLNSAFTIGMDYRLSQNDTEHFVYGRNEDDDDYGIIGGYAQGKFAFSPKLDLVLAGRVDGFDFIDETAFSPRAVLVYKPSPTHTVRFGYNRAVSAPSQLQINIDFPVATLVPGAFDIWLAGNVTGHDFGSDPQIVFNGLLPFPSLPVGTPGLPNAYTYAAVSADVLAQLIPGIEAQAGPDLAAAIQAYLTDPVNTPQGTTGQFFGVNLFSGQPLGLINTPAAQLRTEDTWELGYKGIINSKLAISLDIYNRRIEGSTLFTAISPGYTLLGAESIGSDLGAAVAATGLETYLTGILTGAGDPNAAATAAALTQTVSGAYAAGGDAFATGIQALIGGAILATTPTDRMPNNGVTHLAAGYRTFEAFDYWGADFGLEYFFNTELSAFFNYSYITDNVFQVPIQGTEGTEQTAISQPENKFRLGVTYGGDEGWRGSVSFRHDPSYEVFLGDYSGLTDEQNIVDASIGYKFTNGLALDLSATNLFDSEYRAYPLFPRIGRLILGKLTYSFGENP